MIEISFLPGESNDGTIFSHKWDCTAYCLLLQQIPNDFLCPFLSGLEHQVMKKYFIDSE